MESINFERYLLNRRVPIRAMIQLTYNCNFRCLHCYETPLKNNMKKEAVLDEWKQILKKLRDKGCMFLAFTGGEVLTVPYWCEIYEYAYDLGLKITIATNGSLITPDIIDLFSRKKPEQVHITVYGMSEETYAAFCQKSAMFNRVMNNIYELRRADISTVVMYLTNSANWKELNEAYLFAKSNGCEFYQFYRMRAYVNGDCSPHNYQLDPKNLVSVQPSEELSILKYKAMEDKHQWTKGYKMCNAGLTCITIDPYGKAFLCDSIPAERFSLIEMEFNDAWSELYKQRKQFIEIASACSECDNRELCGVCAPTLLMEYGDCQKKPERECKYSLQLRKVLGGL